MDLLNQTFGDWTVISPPIKKGARIYWHCKCSCGVERDVLQYSLTSGASTSCGHNTKKGKHFANIQNQKFGELTALEPTNERDQGAIIWKCQCSCGNIVYWPVDRLKETKYPHCGCKKSLVGQKFGKLTVLSEYGRSNTRDIIWKCKCECGTELLVTTHDLHSPKTIGCGCSKSIGEYNIAQCLTNNNIIFSKEFTFNDLKDINYLRYDFAIFDQDNNLLRLIEFDGKQHFNTDTFYSSSTLIEHDKLKNQYALMHNIPLIRIPYTEKNNITLDMLLGDTYLV